MSAARASETDLASSLKRSTFLTLGVRPAGGPASARDGRTEGAPGRGDTGGPGTGGHGGPSAVRGVGGGYPRGGGKKPSSLNLVVGCIIPREIRTFAKSEKLFFHQNSKVPENPILDPFLDSETLGTSSKPFSKRQHGAIRILWI